MADSVTAKLQLELMVTQRDVREIKTQVQAWQDGLQGIEAAIKSNTDVLKAYMEKNSNQMDNLLNQLRILNGKPDSPPSPMLFNCHALAIDDDESVLGSYGFGENTFVHDDSVEYKGRLESNLFDKIPERVETGLSVGKQNGDVMEAHQLFDKMPLSNVFALDPNHTDDTLVALYMFDEMSRKDVLNELEGAARQSYDPGIGAEEEQLIDHEKPSQIARGLFVRRQDCEVMEAHKLFDQSPRPVLTANFEPQVDVKSFPSEPIKPLAANSEGTFIVSGGSSGHIYLWEVASGALLKKWHAHYRAVSCLVFSDDDSLLISGADDGSVRVWSLFMIFDQLRRDEASHLYEHSFSEHTLPVTDIVSGYGGCNAIIVSASEDRTCKVWSLSKGKLLRNIVFTSIIDAIALDPGEHVFYAGGRDGKIYIAALNADGSSNNSYGKHIVGLLHDHSKPITCLAFSLDGNLLVSGSEDGMVRVWDTRNRNIVRMFKHAKGPVNNVLVVRQFSNSHASSRRQGPMLPPLKKITNEEADNNPILGVHSGCSEHLDEPYLSGEVINSQIKEFKQLGSAAATEMETERLKHDCKKSMQMVQQWKKMYENLHEFCVNELLDGDQQ